MTLELPASIKFFIDNETTPIPRDVLISLYNLLVHQQSMLDEYKHRLTRKVPGIGRPKGSTILTDEERREYNNRYQRERRARLKGQQFLPAPPRLSV